MPKNRSINKGTKVPTSDGRHSDSDSSGNIEYLNIDEFLALGKYFSFRC
jgi:hypothetical protein